MCPFCLATMGLSLPVRLLPAGGRAALAVKWSRKKNKAGEIVPNLSNLRRNEYVDEHDGKPENSVAR